MVLENTTRDVILCITGNRPQYKDFKNKEAKKHITPCGRQTCLENVPDTARCRLKNLNNAVNIEDLRVPPSNHFEALNGRSEVYSIQIVIQ